ncbi:hypothetical protein Sant_P0136 (plasmid) [Sodalis praecaptivus]|uniref:Uncharacterized protein n=1 Tax=Sodalis praecaptivus TaxID=1239307 RepID=W0I349_9GAMM|nr:DUF3830 family protein [Sodalis praecaptivus]AHF79182.1 hypothetical protein Sant_P0136 [Sodalis praecaptivus]
MSAAEMLEFDVPDLDIQFRARLLREQNPDVVEQVLAQLPLKSVLGHVVVSGEAIWMPTRIVHLGRSNMVQRSPGAVYLYAPGQTICLTYGRITESATVNQFAEVPAEDLAQLEKVGTYVWENTVALPRRKVIEINVKRAS